MCGVRCAVFFWLRPDCPLFLAERKGHGATASKAQSGLRPLKLEDEVLRTNLGLTGKPGFSQFPLVAILAVLGRRYAAVAPTIRSVGVDKRSFSSSYVMLGLV